MQKDAMMTRGGHNDDDDDKFEGLCFGPTTEEEFKWKIAQGLMLQRDGEYFDILTQSTSGQIDTSAYNVGDMLHGLLEIRAETPIDNTTTSPNNGSLNPTTRRSQNVVKMQEYKRSRLDLDSNSIPGSNNSSSTPSPSPVLGGFGGMGGSGGGGGGSGGPYRGKYTRSSLGGIMGAHGSSSSASSRFSPYSYGRDRPLGSRRSVPVIRARREGLDMSRSSTPGGGGGDSSLNTSGFGGSSTSATTQKILESLASMSTPVLNAGRVRIDSIKTVRPLPSMMSSIGTVVITPSRQIGPPKTPSPLIVPSIPTGIRPLGFDSSRWPAVATGQSRLSIQPRMVNAGTSTDEFFDKQIVPTTPSPPVPTTTTRPVAHSALNRRESLKLIDMLAKTKSVNGDYKFDKAWTIEDLNKFLTAQCKKEKTSSDAIIVPKPYFNDMESSVHKKMVNGDDRSHLHAKPQSPTKSCFAPIGMSTSNKWECPSCMVFNESSAQNCVCCCTANPKPSSRTAASPTVDKLDGGTTSTAARNKRKFEDEEAEDTTKKTAFTFGFSQPAVSQQKPSAIEETPASPKSQTPNFKSSSPVKGDVFLQSGATGKTAVDAQPSTLSTSASPSTAASPFSTKPFQFGVSTTSASTTLASIFGASSSSPTFGFGASKATTSTTGSPLQRGSNPSVAPSFSTPARTEPAKTEAVKSTPLSFSKSDKWECPTCMVMNGNEMDKCPCCETQNPNKPAKLANQAAQPQQSFTGSNETSFSSKSKRKHDDDETGEVKKPSFQFGFSAPPATNVNVPTTSTLPMFSSMPQQGSPNNSAFMEALKNANAAIKTTTDVKPSTPSAFGSVAAVDTSKPFAFGSSITPGSGAGIFGAGAQSPPSSSFTFGASSEVITSTAPSFSSAAGASTVTPSTSATPQFSLTPSFNFGSTSTPQSHPGSFSSFGGSQPPLSTTFQFTDSGSTATPAPAPVFQFSSAPSAPSQPTAFGGNIANQSTTGPFSFSSSSSSIAPTGGSAPTPFTFNPSGSAQPAAPSPSFNFGAPTGSSPFVFSNASSGSGSLAPPQADNALFQFSAGSGGSAAGDASRKIKRATRRLLPHR